MTKKELTREEVKISHVCILGRGWGKENALPTEKAELLLSRIGEVEKLHDNMGYNSRVTLDQRLDTIGAIGGGTSIYLRETKLRTPEVGSVAYWGMTSFDLEKLNSELGITTDDI